MNHQHKTSHHETPYTADHGDQFQIELPPYFTSMPMSEMSVDNASYERSHSECLIGGDFWSTTFSEHGLVPPSSQSRRRHTWNSSPQERFTWHVKALRPIPMYHPLETSAVTLDNVTVDEIVQRVSQFLRLNSICAVYHKDRAECRASTGLKFVVQLWQGPSERTVVLEIQRRQGCSFQMRRIRQYLIAAVRDGEQDDRRSLWSFSRSPSKRLCQRLESKVTYSPCDGIDIAVKLLKSRCADQNELGFESLAMSTDVSAAQPAEALEVARALVCGDGKRSRQLRDSVVFYFCNTEESHDTDCERDPEDDDSDLLAQQGGYSQGCHFGRMHNLALTTLLNCLTTLEATSDKDDEFKVDHRSCFWHWVVEALVYNIELADSRPQEAAKSAACLKLLLRLCPTFSNMAILEDRLPVALCQAHEIGKVCHLKLERDSEELMHAISRTE